MDIRRTLLAMLGLMLAFLTESSTFGYGVCKPSALLKSDDLERITKFCDDAVKLRFPAAVADIRHGIDQQRERHETNMQSAVKAALSDEHLALDVGADSGTEFPESRQSKLTAASQQLALDHVLEQLETYAPRMVIVVATDVRDRLFLFDQLRSRLPRATLIDLESDVLLAHPDFLHASRGAGYALVYWSVGILSLALAGLHLCLKRVQETGQTIAELPRRHRCAIAIVGLFACVLSAAPLIASYRHPKSHLMSLDITLMTRLALDIGQGLARAWSTGAEAC